MGKTRARGKGCVKLSRALEVDLNDARSRAHLPHSSARKHSGHSDSAEQHETY